jgi:cell division protein FtsN
MEEQRMKQQHGGTLMGFIIGVLVGLALALAVAIYVNKFPIQFMSKGQSRSADQDAAETKKNKDWDPNAPLYGKNPAKPTLPTLPASAASDAAPAVKVETRPAVSADPLGDLARARANDALTEPFIYFVQVGAFRTPEDAESQRVKLSLSGIEARVSERDQSGRTVFRVRVGPFERKDDADKVKEKLDAAGQETALVRVQR